MEYRRFGNRIIVRIDLGEEIIAELTKVCEKEKIKLGTVSGLGATNKVKVGLYDVKSKVYHATELNDDFEIAPLYGNISTMEGKTYLHIHINLSDKSHKSFGGHLNYAWVSATFEGVIDIMDGEIDREKDPVTGLNLIRFTSKIYKKESPGKVHG